MPRKQPVIPVNKARATPECSCSFSYSLLVLAGYYLDVSFARTFIGRGRITDWHIDDTGVISATLVSIGDSLSSRNLTSFDKSIITSSTALFALLVSPFSSMLADQLGRKHVILYADLLFIIGAIIQAMSGTVFMMVAGRCVIGAGVGAASFVVPLYIAEVAPASHRGRLITTNVLFITMGQMVAYIIGWIISTFASKETGWRWMVGLGAVPAALQCALVLFMPETPRWLVKVGRSAAAKLVVQRINGGNTASTRHADIVIKRIEAEAREEEETRRLREVHEEGPWKWMGSWHELMSVGKNRRALAIACLLQGLQQLCGFVSIRWYHAHLISKTNWKCRTPLCTFLRLYSHSSASRARP